MIRLLAALALLLAVAPAAAQRLAADVDCKPTKHDLVYDCRIALKEAKIRQAGERRRGLGRRRHAVDADGA